MIDLSWTTVLLPLAAGLAAMALVTAAVLRISRRPPR